MAKSVNKVILVGNLGKDPETRHLENGTAVSSFSLATSESYKDRNTGEIISHTDWHNIVLWRGLAEVADKYMKKGDKVYIEGKLKSRSWQDKEGVTRYTTEVVGDNLVMMGGGNKNNGQNPPPPNEESAPKVNPVATDDDDLPF